VVAAGESAPSAAVRRRWTVAVLAFVALEGASLQMRGAVIPVLRRTYGTPDWQLGLVAPAGTVGFLLTVVLVGAIAGRVDGRRLFLVGVAGTGVSVVLVGLTPSFGLFLAALLARGAFGGVGRGSDRPLLSHLYPTSRGRWFSYYDATWAVGATVGPLVVTAALRLGDWRLAYYALGAAFVPLAALVWLLPSPDVGGGDTRLTASGVVATGRRPEVLVMVAGILLSTGVEGALFTWLTTYAEGRVPPGLVAASLSVLLVAYVPGRFAAGRLAERVGAVPLATGLAATCLAATAATFLLATGPWLLAGLFAVGLSLSGLYPTLLTYATETAPEHSAPINALGLVAATGGIAGVPAVLGFVVADAGIAAAMRLLVVPLVLLVVVAATAWRLVDHDPDSASDSPGRAERS
jgi:fucose permease